MTKAKVKIYRNKIDEAVYKAGGPTIVAGDLRLTGGAVQTWIRNGNIPNYRYAKAVSDKSGVPLEFLRLV